MMFVSIHEDMPIEWQTQWAWPTKQSDSFRTNNVGLINSNQLKKMASDTKATSKSNIWYKAYNGFHCYTAINFIALLGLLVGYKTI